jgi:hypothetical protein
MFPGFQETQQTCQLHHLLQKVFGHMLSAARSTLELAMKKIDGWLVWAISIFFDDLLR